MPALSNLGNRSRNFRTKPDRLGLILGTGRRRLLTFGYLLLKLSARCCCRSNVASRECPLRWFCKVAFSLSRQPKQAERFRMAKDSRQSDTQIRYGALILWVLTLSACLVVCSLQTPCVDVFLLKILVLGSTSRKLYRNYR